MATIVPVRVTNQAPIWKWTGITENDDCEPISLAEDADATVQVVGTFGGGSISMEGSLMKDSPIYFTLNDPNENAVTFSAAGGKTALENVWKIRPKTPVGATGASIDVYILVR